MKKAYVLIYSDSLGARDQVKAWADGSLFVDTWRIDLPHTIYLISEATAQELHEDLEEHLGAKGRYLIMEASDNRQGRLTSESWYLLRNKAHKPKVNPTPKLR